MRSIRQLVIVAALVFGGAAWAKLIPRGQATAPAARCALELAGQAAGYLPFHSADSSGVTFRFGPGVSRSLAELVTKAAKGKVPVRKAAFIDLDYNQREVSRLTLTGAVAAELGLPLLDAAAKNAAQFSLKLVGPMTKTTGGGSGRASSWPTNPRVQKKWLPSNFRFSIDGLTEGPRRVSRIEAITIRDGRPSNVILTVAESKAGDFIKWKQAGGLKSGRLEYLTENLQGTLCTVSFNKLQIVGVASAKPAAGGKPAAIKRARIELKPGSIAINCGGLAAN